MHSRVMEHPSIGLAYVIIIYLAFFGSTLYSSITTTHTPPPTLKACDNASNEAQQTHKLCETSSEGVYDRVPDSRWSGVGACRRVREL